MCYDSVKRRRWYVKTDKTGRLENPSFVLNYAGKHQIHIFTTFLPSIWVGVTFPFIYIDPAPGIVAGFVKPPPEQLVPWQTFSVRTTLLDKFGNYANSADKIDASKRTWKAQNVVKLLAYDEFGEFVSMGEEQLWEGDVLTFDGLSFPRPGHFSIKVNNIGVICV